MKKIICFLFSFILINFVVSSILCVLVIYSGGFSYLRTFIVGTIATSRHPQIIEYFLSSQEIKEILNSSERFVQIEPVIRRKQNIYNDTYNNITIENIEGKTFKGNVMQVGNPLNIRLAVTKDIGTSGQRLIDLVEENGAIAGINAGGFYDPNAQGNGAFPDGITIQNGKIVYSNVEDSLTSLIAFDENGRLILKCFDSNKIDLDNIRDAVTFYPYLIVDGKPLIEGDGGWGLAPRTGIGQKADGTVVFVVIDGRQPGWSMGATLRDLMNVFLEYGVTNAANLDGGSSTEMVYQGQIVNNLWSIFGERYIPTAFIVLPEQLD
ncbi:MAG: phosphodiester glycosidase family protein [Eubacteriales bacterium]